jgi:DNA-directed RNA polymerase specialized sigma24 family protein
VTVVIQIKAKLHFHVLIPIFQDKGRRMQDLNINELYNSYCLHKMNKKEFEESLYNNIISNYSYFSYGWKKDDFVDYMCWLYPRITAAIDHYRDTGSSFEAYMCAMLRWSVKEFRSRKKEYRMMDYAAWLNLTADSEEPQCAGKYQQPEMVHSRETEYGDVTRSVKIDNPRQILILILKSYYSLSEDFLERIAPLVGMKKEELGKMVDCLRERRLKREDEIQRLKERVSGQFYRCIALERRLSSAPEDQSVCRRLKEQLERAQKKLKGMRERLSKIRVEATNIQIAETLGVPKGTIDSNLHALKVRMTAGQKFDPSGINFN